MDIITLTIISILSRLAPHLPNMTTVGAMSVFSGAKLGLKKAWIITLITLLVTDLVKGLHNTMWATYGSFLIAACIGKLAASRKNAARIAGAVLFSSCLFFVLTNFAVWLAPNFMYPRTWAGLIDCYIMALPFFRNTLIGDIFYSGVFFGGYELILALKNRLAIKIF